MIPKLVSYRYHMIPRDTGGNPDGDTTCIDLTVTNPDILPKIDMIRTALTVRGVVDKGPGKLVTWVGQTDKTTSDWDKNKTMTVERSLT